ncbi:peptidoglycan D,D-transpeptidase FtsI family protein [Sutcliffiella halmapala]|uniref:peptidoglycan D,D-transpeptidase FtsI family protein n=1 Tax=Sutcliffiella halmapala TaxID=79882 RepID=UPI0009955BE7|nr:penicillin-binding protein 2 [Sutcliffiella halmapala]
MQRLIKRRIGNLSLAIILLFVLLVGRLVQIQLISTESFSDEHINLIEASVKQRTQSLVIDEGRGRFIDRHGKPLTHDYYPSLILFPFLNGLDWPKDELASILGISATNIESLLKNAEKPVVVSEFKGPVKLDEEQMKKINDLDYPGVVALYRQFKLENQVAQQVIGLIGENEEEFLKRYTEKVSKENYSPKTPIGITGLEHAFDEFLLPEGQTKLLYHVDRYGGPLFGIDVRYTAPANPYYPVSVKTTLDKDLQQMAEKILNDYEVKKGGLVLLDIQTNEVLAMVSRPSVNSQTPFEDEGTKNHMLERHFPGSVFKTVIAAGAIEENIVNAQSTFDCSLDIQGKPLSEEKDRKGVLNFEDSFAQSCNYTFGELGKQLVEKDKEAIETIANMLGLTSKVGWQGDVFHFPSFSQIPYEEQGIVWNNEEDKKVSLAVSQTSIGQKEVRLTPLAVANMMATIARGGTSKEVKLVSDIVYKNGATLYSFPEHDMDNEQLSNYTIMQLQHLLREVVTNETGTGRRFQSLPYEVAGKSGTAQTGKKVENGEELVNRWFAGYFPFNQPKYAMVVVELDVLYENNVSSVYYDMVNSIHNWETLER